MHVVKCVFVYFFNVFVLFSVCVCVTVQGKWGSVSGSVCVCAAGTVHVCLPGAVWRGGQEAGGWTAGRLLRHHLEMEQKHNRYFRFS